jgi:hypothetical protein
MIMVNEGWEDPGEIYAPQSIDSFLELELFF